MIEKELRGALYRGDGAAVVGALSKQRWDDSLQFAGDGLLVALAQDVPAARELARRCAAALREREWPGDEELAQRLEAALGLGPVPMLRPLAVDLEQLAGILEGDPVEGGGRILLQSGEVWPQAAIEYAREMGNDEEEEDGDRWLWVHSEGSRMGYRDMEEFIDTIADRGRADRLSIAIGGRGAFRRFKDVLSRWPDELDRWFAYSNDRQRGRARAWLAEEGYTPGPPAGAHRS